MPIYSRHYVMGLLFVFFACISGAASAHKVNVFAYVEGDQVYVEGYFSDGTKAKNSEVTVYGSDGQELTKGRTNEEGSLTFPIQAKQSLRLVLNAGQGHQASYEIPIEEVTGSTASPSNTANSAANQFSSRDESGTNGSGESSQVSELAIRKAVAQGVLPLAREISELKERRGLSDIVGGIGFIVGLLGVFAYIKARQEMRKLNK